MDFSEKWGRDIEEAVNLALIDLNVDRDQVNVIVLEEPSKGFFGIGSKLAKVRVEKIVTEKEQITEEKSNTKKQEKGLFQKKEDREEKIVRKKEKQRKTQIKEKEEEKSINLKMNQEDLEELTESPALDFLKEVTERMGLDLSIKGMTNGDCLFFDITGKDAGTIIGKRGQTLDSIQYLTSLVINKDSDRYIRVIIDAENYRQKREKTLEQLANRLADKVRRTGRSVRLEPMNPYERKIIHSTLQKNSSVTTRSEGEEPYRRVIIEQK